MSTFGIDTGALASAEDAQGDFEYKTPRHLQVVGGIASVAVAAEYVPDYFNGLSGDEQIPCGD